MKFVYSFDGPWLKAIVDRIDTELGYPNSYADTYCKIFKPSGENIYLFLIEDADVTSLLTPEEQAFILDVPDLEDEINPSKTVIPAPISYVVSLGDGRRVLGASSTKSFMSSKSLKGQVIWNYTFPLGDGLGSVFSNGFVAAVPPQSKKIIAHPETGIEAITVEELNGIPSIYLGF